MIGLIRIALRFAWLTIMVLGIRRALELIRHGTDELAQRIEEGDDSGVAGAVVRIHEALLRRGSAEQKS